MALQNQVGCATLQNQQLARQVFENLCPAQYIITDVIPLKGSKKPYCQWMVKYRHTNIGSYAGGENARHIFSEICRFQPVDANPKEKYRSEHPPAFHVIYGVRCLCQPDFSKTMTNSVEERINASCVGPRTLVASLLSRSITLKLCKINDVAAFTEDGQHYRLYLLVLQQLNKTIGKQALTDMFNDSKVNLMSTMPEPDRSKERMAVSLVDRNLNFLYPLLKLQGELQQQIQADSNPNQLFKWIKDNVDLTYHSDPAFITALMTVLLKHITQESTLADGIDAITNPDKTATEKEKQLLDNYRPVLIAFLRGNSDLQLVALFAVQVFCYSVDFPKGMLLRWFKALYDLSVIEEESFLLWKEDLSDIHPGKGEALFQVNKYLTWRWNKPNLKTMMKTTKKKLNKN